MWFMLAFNKINPFSNADYADTGSEIWLPQGTTLSMLHYVSSALSDITKYLTFTAEIKAMKEGVFAQRYSREHK